jgi:HEAT repeat protein
MVDILAPRSADKMYTLHVLTFALVLVTSVCTFVQADDIDQLVAQLKDKHPSKSAEAAQALAALGTAAEPAIPDLVEALADERVASRNDYFAAPSTVGSYASAALVAIGASATENLILELRDSRETVRQLAMQTLGAIGQPASASLPELEQAATQEEQPELRKAALTAYAKIASDRRDAVALLAHALTDASADVGSLAARELGELGAAALSSLPALREAATQGGEYGLRIYALAAYIKIASSRRDTVALLTRALIDVSPDVRGYAAQELGELGPAASPAVPLLVRRLMDEEYRTYWISNHAATVRLVRVDACEALGKIGVSSQNVIDALTYRMARDDDPEVRVSAALALLRLDSGNQGAMNALIAALASRECHRFGPGLPASEDAAWALAQLGPKAAPAFTALTDALEHGNNLVRWRALSAIGAIGGKRAVLVLMAGLDDEDAWVRETAAQCLGKLGPLAAPAVPRLTLALQDESVGAFSVSYSAAEALGKIGPAAQSAVAELQELAESSKNETLRELAAEAIERIEAAKPQ